MPTLFASKNSNCSDTRPDAGGHLRAVGGRCGSGAWPDISRGVGRRHKGFAEEHALQGIECVDAVLAGGGDVAADAAEVREGLEVAERAGDLLPQLHHPQIPRRLVVVEGHREVAHEGEDARGAVAETVEQVVDHVLGPLLGLFLSVVIVRQTTVRP